MSDLTALVARLRAAFAAGRTRPSSWRRAQLTALRTLLDTHRDDLAEALRLDLGRSRPEALAVEADFVIREIDLLLDLLDDWTAPRPVPVSGCPAGSTAAVHATPLGVVLVVAPWNYPVQLALLPLAGALAAGNAAVVKPSELAPESSRLLARLLPRYLDPEAVAVVEGGPEAAAGLLAQRFDHVFYTGGPGVGRIVMRAAAEHLTPVTLELGGKSPVFVDRDVPLAHTARRLVRAKFANAGQACVAPDYVLTDPVTARALEPELVRALHRLYGPDPATAPGYGRIVNTRHFDRLVGLLGSGRTVVGGVHDRATRYLAPTVLAEVPPDAPVMREEVFGPVLPVTEVAGLDEAVAFIDARERPLAVYAFTGNEETRRRLVAGTTSGAVVFGQPSVQVMAPELPFGGVGASGIGAYRGRHSLAVFSHLKPVLDVPLRSGPPR
ncbi:aldehyde dehydrogenase family protein [Streptacidiphilus anmyonensis]|uniref:aldehyde dehydrogenase family protein n=1 Tax=Streptacidiphilus anmyonensis TaxID=405782 RepID=UPI0005A826A2|nr:aldehyde dehydrogenase family protein [Streptacidiphilus anmyonensis]